jgi:hypothetical protein
VLGDGLTTEKVRNHNQKAIADKQRWTHPLEAEVDPLPVRAGVEVHGLAAPPHDTVWDKKNESRE